MTDWAEMQRALKQCFHESTGIHFIWEHESLAMLPKPFGALKIAQSQSIGRDQVAYTFRDSSVTVNVCGFRELTITCQVYTNSQKPGARARDILEAARLMLVHPIH